MAIPENSDMEAAAMTDQPIPKWITYYLWFVSIISAVFAVVEISEQLMCLGLLTNS